MTAFLAWLSARNKALTALIGPALGWGYFVTNSTSLRITSQEWMMLAAIAASAFGVHQIPNVPVSPAPSRAAAARAFNRAAAPGVTRLPFEEVPPNVVSGG